VTDGGSTAAVLQRKAIEIVNVAHVIMTVEYHFVAAAWSAKAASFGFG
jgi:hypothetical protein